MALDKGVLISYCRASCIPSVSSTYWAELGIQITKKREEMILGGKNLKEGNQIFPLLARVCQLQAKSLHLHSSFPVMWTGLDDHECSGILYFFFHTYTQAEKRLGSQEVEYSPTICKNLRLHLAPRHEDSNDRLSDSDRFAVTDLLTYSQSPSS